MSLLGHRTDIMFGCYIQKHDDRQVEVWTRLAKRPKVLLGYRTVREGVTETKVL
jgi:hypothetical protein